MFELTSYLPEMYDYLGNQINRAALSVVLNIAEGSGKTSDKDFNRYIHNALGSIHELYAALDIIKDLDIAYRISFKEPEELLTSIRKQLGGLSKKLRVESWLLMVDSWR